MVAALVASLLLLVTAVRRKAAEPIKPIVPKPVPKPKPVATPVLPRAARTAPPAPKRERRPTLNVHEYQQQFATPAPFKVEITGYNLPPSPTAY
jgi:hypothetical protein